MTWFRVDICICPWRGFAFFILLIISLSFSLFLLSFSALLSFSLLHKFLTAFITFLLLFPVFKNTDDFQPMKVSSVESQGFILKKSFVGHLKTNLLLIIEL